MAECVNAGIALQVDVPGHKLTQLFLADANLQSLPFQVDVLHEPGVITRQNIEPVVLRNITRLAGMPSTQFNHFAMQVLPCSRDFDQRKVADLTGSTAAKRSGALPLPLFPVVCL